MSRELRDRADLMMVELSTLLQPISDEIRRRRDDEYEGSSPALSDRKYL